MGVPQLVLMMSHPQVTLRLLSKEEMGTEAGTTQRPSWPSEAGAKDPGTKVGGPRAVGKQFLKVQDA